MNSNASRPFRVLGLQQVALGGADRSALAEFWTGCLGIPQVGQFRSVPENVDEAILRLGRGLAAVEIDLMQPIDPNAKPRVDKPALHHIGLWVDDLHSAAMWLIMAGVRLTRGGIRAGAGGHEVCFIHPRANQLFPISGAGVLIELVQAPEDIITAYEGMPEVALGV